MSCDMRFASTQAIFNQPEVALGIVPGGCGMTRLPRLINRSRALEVMLGCDDIDAITAEKWVGWFAPANEEVGTRHVNQLTCMTQF